jgi:hypothetical protein
MTSFSWIFSGSLIRTMTLAWEEGFGTSRMLCKVRYARKSVLEQLSGPWNILGTKPTIPKVVFSSFRV